MTDLTDEALDKLITKLGMIHEWKVGVEAAAVITALRQREATAVAGAIEAAGDHLQRLADKLWPNGNRTELANSVRALHTDATRAALDRAKAEGMREAANICDELAIGYAKHKGVPLALAAASQDIIAAADKLEGKP